MSQTDLTFKSDRLVSLDIFRGLTIASMLLVNNPGSWSQAYAPLLHAPWHGWTPTDFVFPFFLFIVGVAMTFSFDKRLARGDSPRTLLGHVFVRAAVLFLLGLILASGFNFRLILPFVLLIAGLQLGQVLPKGERSIRAITGYVLLALGIGWVLFDWRFMSGDVPRGSFKHLFPLNDVEGGSPIRVPGVLQRIALCYLVASLIMVRTGVMGRLVWSLALINVYWLIMRYIPAPEGYVIGAGANGGRADAPADVPFRGELNDWIDVKLLGQHLYRSRPDPEGLLSTLPAIATTLLGALTGMWLQVKQYTRAHKAAGMFILGSILIILGACMDYYFPINKKIWTSSYVVFVGGWAMAMLAGCYYLVDVKGRRAWGLPLQVFGTNPILAFFGASLGASLLGMIKLTTDEKTISAKAWVYEHISNLFQEPRNASLAYALAYVTVWLVLLTPLYWKRIFLKV